MRERLLLSRAGAAVYVLGGQSAQVSVPQYREHRMKEVVKKVCNQIQGN